MAPSRGYGSNRNGYMSCRHLSFDKDATRAALLHGGTCIDGIHHNTGAAFFVFTVCVANPDANYARHPLPSFDQMLLGQERFLKGCHGTSSFLEVVCFTWTSYVKLGQHFWTLVIAGKPFLKTSWSSCSGGRKQEKTLRF